MGDMESESNLSSEAQPRVTTNEPLPGPGRPAKQGQVPKNVSYVAHSITDRQSEL